MAWHDYHFVTHWKIKGPIELIFQILKDGPNYAQWWKPAYQESKAIEGQRVLSRIRAKLPYTLEFITEPIREDPPHELEFRASGELVGTGLWKLHQNGPIVEMEFHWNVRAEKPLVRWLSPFLKPLFRWNHDWVMRTGENDLQAEVNRNRC